MLHLFITLQSLNTRDLFDDLLCTKCFRGKPLPVIFTVEKPPRFIIRHKLRFIIIFLQERSVKLKLKRHSFTLIANTGFCYFLRCDKNKKNIIIHYIRIIFSTFTINLQDTQPVVREVTRAFGNPIPPTRTTCPR